MIALLLVSSAVVLDVYSRRIVGWAMDSHLRTALMLQALDMALAQRRPDGVIHYSDQGWAVHFDRVRTALPRGRCTSLDRLSR